MFYGGTYVVNLVLNKRSGGSPSPNYFGECGQYFDGNRYHLPGFSDLALDTGRNLLSGLCRSLLTVHGFGPRIDDSVDGGRLSGGKTGSEDGVL